jgi:hypothetical protein
LAPLRLFGTQESSLYSKVISTSGGQKVHLTFKNGFQIYKKALFVFPNKWLFSLTVLGLGGEWLPELDTQ